MNCNAGTTLRSSRRQTGITMVEQLVALAVTAAAASTVLPAWDSFSQRRELESAAALLRTDIHHARSLATTQQRPVRLTTRLDTGGACYIVHTGQAAECTCDGSGAARCTGDAQLLRSAVFPATGVLTLRSNVTSMLFDGSWGTVTPTGSLELSNLKGQTLRLVINVLGRVRHCTTSPSLSHVTAC